MGWQIDNAVGGKKKSPSLFLDIGEVSLVVLWVLCCGKTCDWIIFANCVVAYTCKYAPSRLANGYAISEKVLLRLFFFVSHEHVPQLIS